MARFCDRRGLAISESKWRELHTDYDYVHLGEHESENTLIQAVWHGRVDPKAHEMFWEPFSVLVWERGLSGQWLDEPEQKGFSDGSDALQYFEDFVLYNFPKCFRDNNGNLVQVGNLAQERVEAEKKEAAERQAAIEAEKMEKFQKEMERQAAIEAEKERVRKEKEREKKLAEELDEIAELATKGDDYGSWS